MLFEIALTVNPLAFDFGIRRGLRTCASAFAAHVWHTQETNLADGSLRVGIVPRNSHLGLT